MTESKNKENSGINREEAKSILLEFLNNENYSVLALKGKWGVGKTYLVHNFVKSVLLSNILYASVFGLSSIEQLKSRLITNYQDNLKTDTQPHKSCIASILNLISRPIKYLLDCKNRISESLEKTPRLDLGLLGSLQVSGSFFLAASNLIVDKYFHLTVKNSIICIDDIERKSKLALDEVLGFVEYLVREQKCKIILIYDEDNLSPEETKIFYRYREKVIDREFKLEPTVEENLDLIFKDHCYSELIKEVFLKCGTTNIRIMRKTKWLIAELIPLMETWVDSLCNQVIKNSILFNLATFDTEFHERYTIDIKTLVNHVNNLNKPEQIIQISSLGYSELDRLDKLILQLVETPISESFKSKFITEGNLLNKRKEKNQIRTEWDNLFTPIYTSFADNEQEIIDEIIFFISQHYIDLNIEEFEKCEQVISNFDVDISEFYEYEKLLLQSKLEENLDFETWNYYFGVNGKYSYKFSKYPELESYRQKRKSESWQSLNIDTALNSLLDNQLEIAESLEFLESRTVNDYCQWLEEKHDNLKMMVERLLEYDSSPASDKLRQAIEILANCSKLNKLRAKSIYNIDIDKEREA